ncbi:2-isopropylmalate synthase, partial [Burkholderia pseudomallei]
NGETAVFVGARIGDAALRHGAGVHRDPVAAATDAVASAINRSAWSRDKRRAAA